MLTSAQDLTIITRSDFERLPDEGFWEVADATAILMPSPGIAHQTISAALLLAFDNGLRSIGHGKVVPAVNVFVPAPKTSFGQIQTRVPDLIIFKRRPERFFELGQPPELVIEILATRRGNVERTEKLDDYARAGIGEYWIVNPFDRAIEVYVLRGAEYALKGRASAGGLSPEAFSGLQIDLAEIWAALG